MKLRDKRFDQMIGMVFGQLTVIAQAPSYIWKSKKGGRSTSRKLWTCRCTCGEVRDFWGTKLKRGTSFRCGSCGYKTRPQSIKRMAPYERLFNFKIVHRAKKAGMEYSINLEQFKELVTSNCHYCNAEPILVGYDNNKIVSNRDLKKCGGIDRVDSSIGYHIENCLPCCKNCNLAKAEMTDQEFRIWIARIYNFYIK